MENPSRRKQCFLLRLPSTIRESASEMAQSEGTSLNHFISIAVAEKLSRMEQRMTTPHLPAHPMRLVGSK
jgi:hypothetical protein